MISSTSFSSRAALAVLLCLFLSFLTGCASTKGRGLSPGAEKVSIVVLPFENLTGKTAPLDGMRRALMEELRARGITLLEDSALEQFMTRHRIRYVGGIDAETAEAFQAELGIDGVLITSLELSDEGAPPKISLISRLVSTGKAANILWMDSVSRTGDEAPGLLGLGNIGDHKELTEKALRSLTDSLLCHYKSEKGGASARVEAASRPALPGGGCGRTADFGRQTFPPRIVYRDPSLDRPGEKRTIAVVPFFNSSRRKDAGEIMLLHFIKFLSRLDNVVVIEPGVIRKTFLSMRIIMNEGLSLPNEDLIAYGLNADLVITGKVLEYQDYEGAGGRPKVDFSIMMIDRETKKLVMATKSYNQGDDRVYLFDWRMVHTAHALASEMVKSVVAALKGK